MTLEEVAAKLRVIEKRMLKGIRDNMKIQGLHLKMFGDGSGEVTADWSNYRKDMCREEYLLNTIFTREGPLLEFSNPKELEDWLNEASREEEDA